MSFCQKLNGFAIPFIAVLIFSIAAKAQTYKILIDRPEKVGDTYSINATGEVSQNATINVPGADPQKKSDAFKSELDGQIKVLAVDEKTGQPTKLQCTINKLTNSNQSVLDAGTVVTAEDTSGHTTFTVNGMPADPTVAQVLELFLNTHHPGDQSDDNVFGTEKEQSVGATWPIDTAAAAADAARHDIPISKDDVKGEGKLVSVKTVDGKEALEVHADMNVEKLRGDTPNGKIVGGSMKVHLEGLFPTDKTRQALSMSQSMELHMQMSVPGPGGNQIAVDVDSTRSAKVNFAPAK